MYLAGSLGWNFHFQKDGFRNLYESALARKMNVKNILPFLCVNSSINPVKCYSVFRMVLTKMKHNLLPLSHCHFATKVKHKQRDRSDKTHFLLFMFLFVDILDPRNYWNWWNWKINFLLGFVLRFRDATVTRSEINQISQFCSSSLSTILELPECVDFASLNFGRFGNILALSFEVA